MSPAVRTSLSRCLAPSNLTTVALCIAFGFAAWPRTRGDRVPDCVEATTLADGLAEARASGRLVAVDFTSAAAPCSALLRDETLCDPTVRAELARDFVHVELDAERDAELFLACFGSRGYLASCVLDANGAVLAEHAGWSDAGDYALRLSRARSGAHAVAAARELVELAGDDAVAWRALGEACEAAGSSRLAEAAFQRALELAGDDSTTAAFACERLARFAAERGDSLAARAALERIRELDSRALAPRARVTEGLIQSIERTPRLAATTLEHALDSLSEPAERTTALFALARAQCDAGEERDALATFARLLGDDFDPSTRARARDSIVALRTGAHGHSH